MRTLTFIGIIFLAWTGNRLSAQLRINEVMALNTSRIVNPKLGVPGDWIELYNSSASAVDLGEYYLSDNPDNPMKWKFPGRLTLPAGAFMLVWADGTNDTIWGAHASFKLNVAGETLSICTAEGVLVDSMSYPRQYENTSYGYSAAGERIFFDPPSPGSWNLDTHGFRVAGKVRFDPPAGIFGQGIQVTLYTEQAGGIIHYTLDGSVPGLSDPVYTAPLNVTGNTVIRARWWINGAEPGDPSTATYLVHDAFTLPVISLSAEPDHLWGDQNGIYVTGTNGIPGYCSEEAHNWNQDWERPMSLEYFDLQGERQLQIDGGVKIHGGCSRQAPLKSLGFFARARYGASSMEYPFFREKEADEFKGLILRNAGNDFWYSYIRDPVVQATVLHRMDVDDQAYEPVQVYINGEYWGIHNLREKINEHWVTSNYGIPEENLDFLKNFGEVFAGSREDFDELTRFLEEHSLAEEGNYAQVAERIDIPSYRDYLITQMFFANRDWPGNNQKYWRDRTEGSRWRWILYDMEFSMGLYDLDPTINMFEHSTADDVYDWPNPVWATLLIRRLFENEGFRRKFYGQYMIHLNTTLCSERVIAVIDSLYMQIYDEFPGQIDRWHHVPSMEEWGLRVDELRQFATQRPGYVWKNMRDFFRLGSLISLSLDTDSAKGEILANQVRVTEKGFSGHYTSGTELELELRPAPGYCFSHWQVRTPATRDTLLLPRNSVWRFNDSGQYPGDDWKDPGFDDALWASGPGELGYGDGNESTVLDFGPDEENKYPSSWFRTTFEIPDTSGLRNFQIRLMRDDGAIVYPNGEEVLRDNMPAGQIGPDTFALEFVGGMEEYEYFEYPVDLRHFSPGTNTLAVEIHQVSPVSSDISFDLELAATKILEPDTLEYTENPLTLYPATDLVISPVSRPDQRELLLFINEFMASNQGAYQDPFGNDGDWIEVFNAGDTAVDMAGLSFTDDLDMPSFKRIPAGFPESTTVQAAGYLLFFADGNPLAGPLHLDFKLSSTGEEIGLGYWSGTEFIWLDSLRFGTQAANISFGRFPDGGAEWIPMTAYTPGESNIRTPVVAMKLPGAELVLYPNPASDLLNVVLRSADGIPVSQGVLRLYDLTGRKILEMPVYAYGGVIRARVDVSGLPGGIYLLFLDAGAERYSGRVVIGTR
jgi:hypothetical protein